MDVLIKKINKAYKIEDGNKKILSLSMVNCYSKITPEHALDTVTQQMEGKIDSMLPENKNILGLTADSSDQPSKDMFLEKYKDINEVLKDLNKDV